MKGAAMYVSALCDSFLRDAAAGYSMSERGNYFRVCAMVCAVAGETLADGFGPRLLARVRSDMLAAGWCARSTNRQIQRVRAVWRWGVEQEMVAASTWHGLTALRPLRRIGDRPRVRPAPEDAVEAAIARMSPVIGAMARVQLLTAMRPGEARRLRPIELDMSAAVWVYQPRHHKTAWAGHVRRIFIGPRAQEVIGPWLGQHPVDQSLWQPRDVPHSASEATMYDRTAYTRAIHRACDRAGVARWGPNRLRHLAATRIRDRFGMEAARIMLGHTNPTTTQIYSREAESAAIVAASVIG